MISSISYKRIGRLLVILLGIGFLGCCFVRYCSPNYYSAFLYVYIFPIGILAGGCVIRNGELYRDRTFRILGLFYLWYLAAIFLNEGLAHSPGENWKFILVSCPGVPAVPARLRRREEEMREDCGHDCLDQRGDRHGAFRVGDFPVRERTDVHAAF